MKDITEELSQKLRNAALLCSFLVVIIHCVSHFGVSYAPIRMAVYDGICRVAVPFFFFASGFFLCGHIGEKGWYKREILKRFKTLVVPFVAFSLLYRFFHFSADVSWLTVFGLNTTTWPYLVPLWYIRGLIVLMVLSPIITRFTHRGGIIAIYHLWNCCAVRRGIRRVRVRFQKSGAVTRSILFRTRNGMPQGDD